MNKTSQMRAAAIARLEGSVKTLEQAKTEAAGADSFRVRYLEDWLYGESSMARCLGLITDDEHEAYAKKAGL